MKTIAALGLAVLLLTGSAARKPVDVPAIQEDYWMEQLVICMERCPEPRTSLTPFENALKHTHYTCADKTRFLMTSEDGNKHCIAITD